LRHDCMQCPVPGLLSVVEHILRFDEAALRIGLPAESAEELMALARIYGDA